jgi:hypothetical protein
MEKVGIFYACWEYTYYLQLQVICVVTFWHFPPLWYTVSRKIWQPWFFQSGRIHPLALILRRPWSTPISMNDVTFKFTRFFIIFWQHI